MMKLAIAQIDPWSKEIHCLLDEGLPHYFVGRSSWGQAPKLLSSALSAHPPKYRIEAA
jgi:hypothetical protein